jgi:ribosomal protein S18 acetylase RimI-like enzyme
MAVEQRASKRVKRSKTPSTHMHSPPSDSYQERLDAVNSLPTAKFRRAFIPSELLSFSSPKRPDATYRLDFYSAAELPVLDYWRCYALLKETSKMDYKLSTRGWFRDHKKQEMKEKAMRYLILRREDGNQGEQEHTMPDEGRSAPSPVDPKRVVVPHEYAFLSYQLDDDETSDPNVRVPVLYIYEIHLTEPLRSLGLGRHFIHLAELIASKTMMEKLELSVFRRNAHAESFYRNLGFVTDETSPQPRKVRNRSIEPDWLVLSKKVARKHEAQDVDDTDGVA